VTRTIDVFLTADTVAPARLGGASALAIDVLRASTSVIAALGNGAAAVIPVETVDEARACRAALGREALLAGERHGDPPEGFDLGNSPREFTAGRVRGRTIVLTTSNGTRALFAARPAAAVAVAAFVNASAAAAWARERTGDVVLICAGSLGTPSLEDQACAGWLTTLIAAAEPTVTLTPRASEARDIGLRYGKDLEGLARDARHVRSLQAKGHGADVAVCFALDTSTVVPVLMRGGEGGPGVDKLVWGPR
jgi:2-phosphosulfolactate phosphatase